MRPTPAAFMLSTALASGAAVPSTWDGECFYPAADIGFELDSYLGRWYQVAGTLAPFTAGCKCIFAEYQLNDDGTVQVNNSCEAQGAPVNIVGSAGPANPSYGAAGVFRVQFPRQPSPACPGPNYIVQDYTGDFAIVQSSNFSTLFVLSREQRPPGAVLDAWIERAGLLGSNLDRVAKTSQEDCAFT
ncbi:hypothetical protein MAPG_11887 [Magnaporthiopsis poae ATCC 64411]|uniref:Lipocalin/cytosolic fatty-acid binding domain-containing protein n=1 Tax=Magnaporthiopsis poae (strain ATCC 64411 / 73-15) TaxID=644358 RepID=A0A0C4EGF0_MAGP6|nr:hypothetical protein MAPG_11887 [Magnaporthiopsis poae ATCC 64411]